jgi:hypothetical protein
VIGALGFFGFDNIRTASSATIDGQAATIRALNSPTDASPRAFLFSASGVTPNSTVDFVVTFTDNPFNEGDARGFAWTASDAPTSFGTAILDNGTVTPSVDLDIEATMSSGDALAFCAYGVAGDATVTGETASATASSALFGHYNAASAGSPHTVTIGSDLFTTDAYSAAVVIS